MTELQLYKFIKNNNVSLRWYEDQLLCFLDGWLICEFCQLLGPTSFDDDGIPCHLKDRYITFNLSEVCDSYGIEPENILSKEEQ